MALECNLQGTIQEKDIAYCYNGYEPRVDRHPIHKKQMILCFREYAGKEQESSCNPNN